MKKLIPFLMLPLAWTSCKNDNAGENKTKTETSTPATFYGEKINADNAIPVEDLQKSMGDKTEMNIKISGKVDGVCQKKGCWMELKNSNGDNVRVTFKDYGFFVPMDCAGKTAIVEGIAKIEETSVQDLKEYAKDEGQSKEEIDAITEPLKELVFEANGVMLQ